MGIHASFEEVEKGRLRCRLCYQKWFSESAIVAVQKGKTEDEAKAEVSGRVPSPASVPSFAKAGTENMKNHLVLDIELGALRGQRHF